MWFKNLQLFQFIEPFIMNVDELNKKLQEHQFVPCKSIESMRQGFVTSNGREDGELIHMANGFLMLCLQKEEKIVPGAVVKQTLDAKVAELEKAQGRKIRKREKEEFKEEILHNLTTRAFSKISKTYAYIDATEGLLVIDTSSHNKSEEFNILLRKALGSLKIELPKVQNVMMLMTEWVKTNQYPAEFAISDNGVLVDPKDQGTIRCKRKSFFSGDFEALINDGCMVSELGMTYQEEISFTLKDDFSVKGIKFLESVQDQANDIFTETEAARFDANFTIMTETLRHFIRALFQTFKA